MIEGYIPQNYVLVRPDENFRSYQNKGEETGIATGNDAYSAGQRLSVRGTIVQLPHRLIFNGPLMIKARSEFANDKFSLQNVQQLKEDSVLFGTDIEPKVGDTVFFNYNQHYECYEKNRFIEDGDKDLLLMKYDSLILSHGLNNIESIRPLNGLVLLEPVDEISDTYFKIIKDRQSHARLPKTGIARVILTGKKCKGYLEDLNAPEDTDQAKKGDIVLYKPLGAHPVEWGLHQVLFKGRNIIAIHRKFILRTM